MKVRFLGLFVFIIGLVCALTQKGFAQEPRITPTPQNATLTTPTPAVNFPDITYQQIQSNSTTGETLIVPFVNGTSGVRTNLSYTGTVTVTVSGAGQGSGPSWSDAFYIYTDYSGQPIVPVHPTAFYNWTLWINGGPADNYVNPIPAYNPNHIYTFVITATGGPLTFAVGDTNTSDNAGAYKVTVGSVDNSGLTRIVLPLKWCALEGSPAANNARTLAQRTQQIVNHIYLPKADISFQSGVPTGVYFEIFGNGNGDDDGRCEGGEACSSAFPVISDPYPNSPSNNKGDVQIHTNDNPSDELNRIMNTCFDVWNFALSSSGYSASFGIITVNIRQFVDHNGNPSSYLGLSAIGSQQTDVGVVSVIDNAFTKGVPWLDTKDILLAHEMGHSLSLEQSPSHHHPFLLNLMHDTFIGYNLQTQLTRNASNLDDSTTQVGQMRNQARHYIGVIIEPQPIFVDPPLGDAVFALVGNLPLSEAFIDLSSVGLHIDQDTGITTFYFSGFGPFPDNIQNLNYMFLLDSDNNPNTGASSVEITSEIGIPVTFTGVDYLLQIEVDIINKSPQVSPIVKRYQTGTFVTINDPSIQAQASEVIFEPLQVTPSSSDSIIRPYTHVTLQMDSGLIALAVSPRFQGIARNTNTQVVDMSDIKKVSFNTPIFPNCIINPTEVESGDQVVIIASNLPSRSTGQVMLDNQVVATKVVDVLGNVTIPFTIPENTLSGIQLVNVIAENTAVSANCYLSVVGPNEIYLPIIIK